MSADKIKSRLAEIARYGLLPEWDIKNILSDLGAVELEIATQEVTIESQAAEIEALKQVMRLCIPQITGDTLKQAKPYGDWGFVENVAILLDIALNPDTLQPAAVDSAAPVAVAPKFAIGDRVKVVGDDGTLGNATIGLIEARYRLDYDDGDKSTILFYAHELEAIE